ARTRRGEKKNWVGFLETYRPGGAARTANITIDHMPAMYVVTLAGFRTVRVEVTRPCVPWSGTGREGRSSPKRRLCRHVHRARSGPSPSSDELAPHVWPNRSLANSFRPTASKSPLAPAYHAPRLDHAWQQRCWLTLRRSRRSSRCSLFNSPFRPNRA